MANLQQVFKPDPLFCMMSPVTQYLKGLLSLHSPLITKSMRLLTLAFDFYLLQMALTSLSACSSLMPKRLLTASSMIFITSSEMNSFCIRGEVRRLRPCGVQVIKIIRRFEINSGWTSIQMKSLLRSIMYRHVGRKHIEKVAYSLESCRHFNLILQRQQSQPQNQRKLASKAVNRLFVSCLFSRIIGNNFPLSIYISQTVKFHRDVQYNEEIVGEIEVIKDLGKRKFEISTVCKSEDGEILVQGVAVIMQE